jgi:WhiB family redox-sensing transcriptional regulator
MIVTKAVSKPPAITATQAHCHGHAEEMFIPGAEQNRAKRYCTACPIRLKCLAEALAGPYEFGVWGGLTDRERRTLRRRRPDVTNWHALLARVRDHYTSQHATIQGLT